MKYPRPLFVLLGVILLIFILIQFIPWQALIMIAVVAFFAFAFLGHLSQQAGKERSTATPQYQPPPRKNPPLGFDLTAEEYRQLSKRYQQGYRPPQKQSPEPEPPPRKNPPLGFDLTTEEYQQLSKRYQQGHQVQMPPPGSPSGSPLTGNSRSSDQPKQDHPRDYEQPQTQYPQMPPMA